MEILYTKNAQEKFATLKQFGWRITKTQVKKTIGKPKWIGKSRFGQKTAMSLVDNMHILRVIFNLEDDKIKIITFHIARRGKYESAL
ncbi:MAG: hypothetical protein UY21_C0001G0126 [Microgenomates group bacterium GW2011_GWA1_48_10]|nr:MAG: hypothetical protein UY21_C0001G0126 [Microgenomates group bacterium GW2011_GWA1_48_10]